MFDHRKNRLGSPFRSVTTVGLLALIGLTSTAVVVTPQLAGATVSRASSVCSKVSSSQISSIVGYSVPAGKLDNTTLPATKDNFEISTKSASCTYGSYTSLSTIPKVVILSVETTSRPLTSAEFKRSLAELASDGIKMTIKPFSGLPGTAYYFAYSASGINAQGLSVFDGTHGYGAAVETNKLSQAKLAQLTKLAASL